MKKEQYIFCATLMFGMITCLPNDDIIDLAASNLESGPTNTKDKIITKEKVKDYASKLPAQTMCGERKVPIFQIFGRSESQLGAWPWMVILGYRNSNENNNSVEWLCSDTLISNTHVLTASACVANTGKKVLTVSRLGELDLDPMVDDRATPLDIPIKRIIHHERINPADMFTSITGYEKCRDSKQAAICCRLGKYQRFTSKQVICAGYLERGKDSCRGNSGGPLMWLEKKQFYLIGIVSNGFKESGHSGLPCVLTRVMSYMDWILDSINN